MIKTSNECALDAIVLIIQTSQRMGQVISAATNWVASDIAKTLE